MFGRPAHLAPVDGVLGGHDLVRHLVALEHHEAEAARAPRVAVVADEGLVHRAVVLEVLAQLLVRRLPAETAYEYFTAAGHGAASPGLTAVGST
jgi:hypothetical protein